MPGKKFWRRNAKAVTKLLRKEERFNDKANDQIEELQHATAEAMVILLPIMEGSETKKRSSAKAAEWYSKYHHLVPNDEEGEDAPVGDTHPLRPDPDAYDETDDLTLFGVPVRVSMNHDDGYYDVVRRDNNLPANGTDDPVPADQLTWRGRWKADPAPTED